MERAGMWGPGPVCLVELADGFGHPHFMFCGLPHEEEGQGVTGEVEEALPVPGGIGLGIRDEGRDREVWREDGAEPIYVPQELGVPALHTSGGVEGGEAVNVKLKYYSVPYLSFFII